MQGQKCTIGSEARDEVPGDMPLRRRISRKPGDETTSMHKSLGLCIVRSYTPCLHAAQSILKCQKVSAVYLVILTVVFC